MFDGVGNEHRTAEPPNIAAHVGPAGWARLAPAIRCRFGAAQAHRPRTYHGAMDVWRSSAGLVLALLGRAFGGPLPCRRGLDVPAEVRVRPEGAGMGWERLLRFGPGRTERVASAKLDGPDGRLLERTDAGLVMELDVFEQGGALVFRSRRYLLQLGRWRVPIPALLTPGTCEVRHEDAGPGRFRFTLTASHPVWGLTFRQDGLFRDPLFHEPPFHDSKETSPC